MTTTTARPSTRSTGDGTGATRTRQNHAHRNAGRPMARYPSPACTAQRARTPNFGLIIAVVVGTVINTNSNGESRLNGGKPYGECRVKIMRAGFHTLAAAGIGLAASVWADTGDRLGQAVTCAYQGDFGCADKEFRAAVESGSGIASLAYAKYLFERGRQSDAVAFLQTAAEFGLAEAQYKLGLALARGEGVHTNLEGAAEWIRRAADQRYPPAILALSRLFEGGVGVGRNAEMAKALLRQAAQLDLAAAQIRLAEIALENGDTLEAAKWYQLAKHRSPRARKSFQRLIRKLPASDRRALEQNRRVWEMEADVRHGTDFTRTKLPIYSYVNYEIKGHWFFVPDEFSDESKGVVLERLFGRSEYIFYRPQYHGQHTFYVKATIEDIRERKEVLEERLRHFDQRRLLNVVLKAHVSRIETRVPFSQNMQLTENYSGPSGMPVLPLSGSEYCYAYKLEFSVPEAAGWQTNFLTREVVIYCSFPKLWNAGRAVRIGVSERYAPDLGAKAYQDFDYIAHRVLSSLSSVQH